MKIFITDSTLRDGNHASGHKIKKDQIELYCQFAEKCGITIVEVGHGNGLGASSLQLGKSVVSDEEMLLSARKFLHKTKLGIHVIPGFGRIDDLNLAMDIGVDVFRIASHCTEATVTKRHIEYLVKEGKTVFGVLMMSHMIGHEELLKQSKLMASYGAQAVIIMDSAGHYLPNDVRIKISYLTQNLNIPVGFHAHNNLCLAVANSMEAISSGAVFIDGTIGGYGAGAGNTPIEVLAVVLERISVDSGISSHQLLENSEQMAHIFEHHLPNHPDSIISGIYGVFSGFLKPVQRASKMFDVNIFDIYKRLGEKKVIAGQEDLITEIARELSHEH